MPTSPTTEGKHRWVGKVRGGCPHRKPAVRESFCASTNKRSNRGSRNRRSNKLEQEFLQAHWGWRRIQKLNPSDAGFAPRHALQQVVLLEEQIAELLAKADAADSAPLEDGLTVLGSRLIVSEAVTDEPNAKEQLLPTLAALSPVVESVAAVLSDSDFTAPRPSPTPSKATAGRPRRRWS